MRRTRAAAPGSFVVVAVSLMALPAGATVTGSCDGSAEWVKEKPPLVVVASELTPGEVVVIPLKGNVTYTGVIDLNPPPTESRDVSGNVKVKVPFPVGTVQVGTWSSSGTLTGNSGTYEYDFPSILSGFEVTARGATLGGNAGPGRFAHLCR